MRASNALSLSGNEITDFERRQALLWGINQSGGSTDGITPPGGMGIWEAGTNLFTHGQCDSNTGLSWGLAGAGGVVTSVDPLTPAPFSPQSIKYACDGSSAFQGINAITAAGQNAAAGTMGTGSIYFKGVAGQSYQGRIDWKNTDASFTFGTPVTFVASGDWQLVIPSPLAVAAGKVGDILEVKTFINGTRAETFNGAHAMLQIGVLVVSPYIATSGGTTAGRNAALVSGPKSWIPATTGWFACMLNMGWNQTDAINMGFRNLIGISDVGVTNCYGLQTRATTPFWKIQKVSSGVSVAATAAGPAWVYGDLIFAFGKYDANGLDMSVNGGAFSHNAGAGSPDLSALNHFEIGTLAGGGWIDSRIRWAAVGQGSPTIAQVQTLYAYGVNAPPLAATPDGTFVWNAVTQQIQVASEGFATEYSDVATNLSQFAS